MNELECLRQEIDAVDGELVRLFLTRMEITGRVGQLKLQEGLPVLDAAREKRVIAAKTALTDNPARRADVANLYESIMAISRRQQRQLVHEGSEDPGIAAYEAARAQLRPPVAHPRVVYQGEPGAYSEEAARGFFGPQVQSQGLPWFDDAFLALRDGQADYAVLPIENSSTGSIRQVYDLLAQYSYHIVGEYQVKVDHCLMALPGVSIADIQTVYSHEQGLMQSEKFLERHRDWRQVPTLDTAGSAKQVASSGDRTAAAICSRRAAELYGLDILAQGVNHNQENHTRFVVISPRMELRPGRNKISALFRLPHQSGSLHEILTIFAVQGLNLIKLESRPEPGKRWEYLFFLEFTGDLTAPDMDGVLHELSQLASNFRVLGNFPAYPPSDGALPPAPADKKNIVLIGMPGSGKTTVGEILSRRLNMPLVDTDQLIQAESGTSIPAIFETGGEALFRTLEAGAVAMAGAQKGVIIATGGGVIKRPENMACLAEHGLIFFLDRPPEDIAQEDHSGRPLVGEDRDTIFALYTERIEHYRAYAQYIIPGLSGAEQSAQAILDRYSSAVP